MPLGILSLLHVSNIDHRTPIQLSTSRIYPFLNTNQVITLVIASPIGEKLIYDDGSAISQTKTTLLNFHHSQCLCKILSNKLPQKLPRYERFKRCSTSKILPFFIFLVMNRCPPRHFKSHLVSDRFSYWS